MNRPEPRFCINKLATDMKIERGGSRLKRGTKKLSIRSDYEGEYDIQIWAKADGAEIRWSGRIDTNDLHPKEGELWVWNYSKLSREDMKKLAVWLWRKAAE